MFDKTHTLAIDWQIGQAIRNYTTFDTLSIN